MTIHRTNQWLDTYLDKIKTSQKQLLVEHQKLICKPLTSFFRSIDEKTLQEHLIRHGLFLPHKNNSKYLSEWLEKDFYPFFKKLYQKLKRAWDGPEADIFLFPSNENSRELQEQFKGNAGLSYPSKLFLFLSPKATPKALTALFLHEYSHTCRLHYFEKAEEDYTLLDAIILEGTAEYLVRRLLGSSSGSQIIQTLSEKQAKALWDKWIKKYRDIKRLDTKHDLIMYGKHGLPNHLGYNIGYYLVSNYAAKQNYSSKKILYTPNEEFLSIIKG